MTILKKGKLEGMSFKCCYDLITTYLEELLDCTLEILFLETLLAACRASLQVCEPFRLHGFTDITRAWGSQKELL